MIPTFRPRVALGFFVPATAALEEAALGKPSPFHLRQCKHCEGPCFGYPCALCGAYPDGGDPPGIAETARRAARVNWERERAHFLHAIEAEGNTAAWYFSHFRRTVAWGVDPQDADAGRIGWSSDILGTQKLLSPSKEHFRAAVDALVSTTRSADWPSGEEIWIAVADRGRVLSSIWYECKDRAERRRYALFTLSVLGLPDPGDFTDLTT
jgi:hypothetical protein